MKSSSPRRSRLACLILFNGLVACSSLQQSEVPRKSTSVEVLSACEDGQTREGFLDPISSGEGFCWKGKQTCKKGQWTGPSLKESC